MGNTLNVTRADGRDTTLELGPGSLLLGPEGSLADSPAGAAVALHVDRTGAVWAIIGPSAACDARIAGRGLAGRLALVGGHALVVGELTYNVTRAGDAIGRDPAETASRCGVCGLEIEPGREILRCPCGLVADSRFCLRGGASENRCFHCGREFE